MYEAELQHIMLVSCNLVNTMSIIAKNRQLISSVAFKSNSSKVSELAAQLAETTDRLEALLSQASAQFACGDAHATFNKQTIQAIEK